MSNDKVIVITGATGNLGKATAEVFHRLGAKTALVDRSSERLQRHFPQYVNSANHHLAGDVDVANAESINKAIDEAIRRFGRIDALVNTVGGFRGGKRVDQDDLDDWDFLMDINLRTALVCSRAVIPHLIKQGSGRIINVASRAALAGSGLFGAYSASKAAVLRLTESLSEELKEFGINVNCVLPGTIDTPQNRTSMPSSDFSKWVSPSAVSEVIAFLTSDAASGVTGAAIPVYGRG